MAQVHGSPPLPSMGLPALSQRALQSPARPCLMPTLTPPPDSTAWEPANSDALPPAPLTSASSALPAFLPACLSLHPCVFIPPILSVYAPLLRRYVFPRDQPGWRSRVGVALSLLLGSKLLNIQVGAQCLRPRPARQAAVPCSLPAIAASPCQASCRWL